MSEQELSTYMDFIRLIEDMNTINSIKNRKNNNTHDLSPQSFTDDIEEDPAEISTTASTRMSLRHILEYNIITITDMTPTTFNNINHHKSLQGYTLPDLTNVNIINLTVMNLRLSHDSGHQPLHTNTDIILVHCLLVGAKISFDAQSQIFDRGHPHPQERRNAIRTPLLLLLIPTATKSQFIKIHPILPAISHILTYNEEWYSWRVEVGERWGEFVNMDEGGFNELVEGEFDSTICAWDNGEHIGLGKTPDLIARTSTAVTINTVSAPTQDFTLKLVFSYQWFPW
jgi:hypothetical protein